MTVAETAARHGPWPDPDAAPASTRAPRRGAPRLYLETNSGLAPALGLYRAMGFVAADAAPSRVRCRGHRLARWVGRLAQEADRIDLAMAVRKSSVMVPRTNSERTPSRS